MTLAEKITALRGERKLSQGDLAEYLDVSRQSVSKWETGQSVPELEKIVKLADLFGVTVDELVRDTEAPKPEAPKVGAAERTVYIERPKASLTPVQILGVVCLVMGAGLILLSLIGNDPELILVGAALAIMSLPLLLAKKHPFLIVGWLAWVIGYGFLCTPFFSGALGARWQPFMGFITSMRWLIRDGSMGGNILVVILFYLVCYAALSVLTVLLPSYTAWLCWKKWQAKSPAAQEADG